MTKRNRVAGRRQWVSTSIRGLHFESLEVRHMLSADFGNSGPFSQLSVDIGSYAPDSILVRFEADAAGPSSWQAVAGTHFNKPLDMFPLLRQVQLGSDVSVEEAIAIYAANPLVAYAEPNYNIQLTVMPDDPRYDETWGLNNTGQTGGVDDVDIDAPEAWEVTQGSSSTIVAVIDTGVDYTHVDLASNIWVNQGEQNGLPGIDDDGNGYVDDIHGYDFFNRDGDPRDDHNHGTHVAGTIGAVGNDGVGVAGVNWNVQIMALKFLNSQGSGSVSTAIEALNYAVANGASISNNSWGDSNFSQALHDAILDADQAGHIVVAAAGNGNFVGLGINNDLLPFYPASYDLDNLISVAAIDHEGEIARFSNFGQQSVDLGAPGVGVLSTTIGNSYSVFSGTSMATPHVTGVTALVRGLHPEWTHHEVIAQVLGTAQPLAALAGITATGGLLNAATAVGNPETTGPEVLAFVGSRPIINGQSVIDFGATPPGSTIEKVIGVRNIGTEPLTLSGPASLPAGFTLVSGLGATTLAPGEQTSLTVQLDAIAKGIYGGPISILTNDADENPLLFDVSGDVDFVPLFLDNGSSAFSTVGQWDLWSNQGFQGDVHESFAGNGSDVARWTFDNMAPGLYQVAATWTTNPNRATDAPFRILDGGTFTSATRVNQQAPPDDLVDAGVGWEILDGLVAFTGDTLTIELSDDADGRLNADAIRIKRIDDLPAGPEVVVVAESGVVEDGSTSIDFGQTPVGIAVVQTFTVRNVGLQDLELTGPVVAPAGFTVVDGLNVTTLAPGEGTSFSLRLDAIVPGTFGGAIQFGTNDPDENSFDFLVTGAVELLPIFSDNGDANFSTTGEWASWTNQGYQGDVHESFPGSGADVASWTFDNLPPGQYQVSATWTQNFNRATNAPFTLLDGTTPLGLVHVDQTLVPVEFVDQGVSWDHLGQPVTVISGSLVVQLADDADGRLNADAIRVERAGDLATGPALEVVSNGQAIAAGGGVDLGVTSPGTTLQRTFTLRNSGSSPLDFTGPVIVPAGFTLATGPAATTLASGESTTMTVALDATSDGQYSGAVTIPTNDPGQGLFVFSVIGLVEDQPIVIDDSDPAFTTVGEWTRWTNQGFEGDIQESLPGVGDDVARWTFTGLAPGQYTVAATWTPDQNRASDAPFAVLDGATLVSATEVNQKLGPAEFFAEGVFWNTLDATVTLTGDTLTVQLSDDANGRLNADAIRIERFADLATGSVAEVLSSYGAIDIGGTFDFGRTHLGAPVTHALAIRNAGTESLELTSTPTIPSGYTLMSSFTPTELDTGESVEFVLRLDAASEDLFSGEVTVASSDPGVGTVRFNVLGLVAPPPRIIDNGDVDFSSLGEWTSWGGQGFGGDVHESLPGSGADVATWTFDNLLPGRYRVAATWTAWINRATNSPFTVLDGTVSQGTVTVNQQLGPVDFTDQGAWWTVLGEFDATSGTLTVELSDAANGRLNADAIRVEFVEPLLTAGVASTGSASGTSQGVIALSLEPSIDRPESRHAARATPQAVDRAVDLAFESLATDRPIRTSAESLTAFDTRVEKLGAQVESKRRSDLGSLDDALQSLQLSELRDPL